MATILPLAETQFTDALGVPLAGGSVFFYTPSTTTAKDTYADSAQTIANSNPVILDSGGRAIIFGSGAYRQVVYDANGNLIWDQTTSEAVVGSASFGGTSTGSANAQVVSAGTFSGADGSTINFTAGFTNTGAMTVQVGPSGSPIAVLKNGSSGPVDLAAGDIVAGNIYSISYSVTLGTFQLLQSIPPVIQIASQAEAQAGSNNTNVMTPLRTNEAIQALGTPAPAVKAASWPLRYNPAGTLPEYVHPINMGIFGGLKVQVTSNTQVTITAPLGLSVTGDISASGANGLDTGTKSNSTWYNVWVIWNGATAAALLSLSATAPTMPSGYVNKVRVGAIRNDASGNLWRTIQYGRRAQIVVGANPATAAIITSGSSGSPNTPTYTAVSWAGFFPPTAAVGNMVLFINQTDNQGALLAPNGSYGAWTSGNNAAPAGTKNNGITGSTINTSQVVSFVLESGNIYYASNSNGSYVYATGWEDNI
jgi:hypothetical protein